LDYYLKRFSKKGRLHVDGTVRRGDERKGGGRTVRDLKRMEAKVGERDYLIVAFPFDSVGNFPGLMASLQSRYSVAFSQMNRDGRGYIVFKARAAESGASGASPAR
jgi:hypothetical protein